jgi:hypothetical protein
MNIPSVAEVYKLHGTTSLVMNEYEPLEKVIGTFAQQPSIRGVFLVDRNQYFNSVITRIDFIRWVHLQLSGGKGMDRVSIWDILKLVEAKTAKDLALSYQKYISVKESDSLQTALDKMLRYEEDIIPVLDHEGKVLGDLRLSEVLWWFLSFGKQNIQR